ncbi:MAG: hypothetical protein ACYTXY_45605, partial [Nostoc sp.]
VSVSSLIENEVSGSHCGGRVSRHKGASAVGGFPDLYPVPLRGSKLRAASPLGRGDWRQVAL